LVNGGGGGYWTLPEDMPINALAISAIYLACYQITISPSSRQFYGGDERIAAGNCGTFTAGDELRGAAFARARHVTQFAGRDDRRVGVRPKHAIQNKTKP
jgi:hypothetical protein